MKQLILLILTIILALPLTGNPIDENTAKQLAQNFWKENNIMGVRGDKVFKKKMGDAIFVNVATRCGYSEFYIFNNEDGKGFVIIAADDCVTPVLAYSYENNFATDTLTPDMKWWLDGYSEQIQKAVALRATATDEIHTEWESLMQSDNLPIRSETAVNPLITTTWGQGEYYNAQCPSILGFHLSTGCVATAMAQIMKYWNYPSHGYNYHSYECWPYGVQSANFGGTNYQWSYMPNSVTSSNNAVATLMYHCGVSVEMNYGIQGSGAKIISFNGQYEYCAENAFKTFFGYSQNLSGIERQYNESNWTNILKNELNNSRPILYGGQGTGGHAFVCDGYNNSNYFHFNWGWSGESNGYYTVNNLNPLNGGDPQNYNLYQHALIGIQPDNNLQSFDLVLYDDVQMVGDTYGNYGFGQSISAYAEILNNGNSTFSGYVAAAVFDDDAYFIDFLGGGYTSLEPNFWTSDIVEHDGGIPFLPSYDFLYHTIMFYSIDGTYWSMVNPGNYDNDAVFQVFNNGEAIETNSPMTFSNGEEDVLFNGQSITINVEVLNQGNYTYNDGIWLALLDSNENYVQIIDVLSVNIPVGNSVSLNYTDIITAPEGQYYLALLYYYPENHARYVGAVFYPSIKRVYVINPQYTISATANPNNGGVITGGGTYNEGETCILTATANNGYTFINWTENGTQVSTNPNYTFTITGNRNLVANFQAQQYTISITPNPSNGGSVSGGGTYNHGQSCTVNATVNPGYTFVNWTENGTQVSTNPNYTFTVTGNRNLVAHFQQQQQQYTISVSANPSNGGSASGGGTFSQGASCTVHATANSSYTFVNWTENGIVASSNPNYTFTVTGNRNLVANFQIQSYTIAVAANPSNGGTVIGGGSYNYGQTCTVHATASGGYTFSNWTENGSQVSTNANYSFTVTGNRTLVANFLSQTPQTYTITAMPNPAEGGYVTIANRSDRDVVFSDDFENGIDNWTMIDADGDGNNWYTLNWIEAGWEETGGHSGDNWVTSASYFGSALNPDNYLISPQISLGGTMTFWACAQDPNYAAEHFGVAVSTTSNTDVSAFTTIQEWTLPAKGYGPITPDSRSRINRIGTYYQYTVDLSAYAGQTGYIAIRHFDCSNMFRINVDDAELTISGGGGQIGETVPAEYTEGQTCILTAIPFNGYHFVNWTENGTQVSTNANYSFTVTCNRNLVANFAQIDGTDENVDAIEVYPNPTSGIVNINCHDMVEVKVFNALGVMVRSQIIEGEDNAQFDLSTFSDGLYILQAISPTQTTTIRVVKAE